MMLKDSASRAISGCLGSGMSGVSNSLLPMAREAAIICCTGVSRRMTIKPVTQPSATHSATTTVCSMVMRSFRAEMVV